jgi:tetratricopeptide (TPR) repeat protein
MRKSNDELVRILPKLEETIERAVAVAVERAIGVSPDDHESYLSLADAYLALNERAEDFEWNEFLWRRAVAALKKAAEISPESLSASAWDMVGCYQTLAQTPQEAIKSYEQAILLEPDNGIHHVHLAGEHENLKDHQSAIESYRAALNKTIAIPEYRQIAQNGLERLSNQEA